MMTCVDVQLMRTPAAKKQVTEEEDLRTEPCRLRGKEERKKARENNSVMRRRDNEKWRSKAK